MASGARAPPLSVHKHVVSVDLQLDLEMASERQVRYLERQLIHGCGTGQDGEHTAHSGTPDSISWVEMPADAHQAHGSSANRTNVHFMAMRAASGSVSR